MAISSADQHLAVIPETAAVTYLPGSAQASPRSTSDSPVRASQPISPNSRLLQPTLSWQAKAGWVSEPSEPPSNLTNAQSSTSRSQAQVSMIADSAKRHSSTEENRLSPVPPSASWQSREDPVQSLPAGDAKDGPGSISSQQQPLSGQAAQDKGNHPRGLQQDDLAKRSGTTAWQQQRLQLRAVMSPSGSPSAQSGSPSGFRYADASVDTLQQQRAKLRPVQTSKQAVLPTQQGFVAPVMRPGGAARPKEAQPLPAATAGPNLAARAPLPSIAAEPNIPPKPQPTPAARPIASQASQLRTKFGQLTDLLQNTALQRGISLSQVPIPTRKPDKNQRVSLEEVRTSFRSFTAASSAANGSKAAPLRRVSTGAITPAFLKEKNKLDKALLESLGVADAATDVSVPAQPSDDASPGAAAAWVPRQSTIAELPDETPAVFTRGKGWARPTGPSFDIKSQTLEVSEEDSSAADTGTSTPSTTAAAQTLLVGAGENAARSDLQSGSTNGVATAHFSVASAASTMGAESVSGAAKGLQDAELDVPHQRHAEGSANAIIGKAQTARGAADALSNKLQLRQPESSDLGEKKQLPSSFDDGGIKSSSVQVDVMLAPGPQDKVKAVDNSLQLSGEATATSTGHASTGRPMETFCQRVCCSCCSTKE